MGETRQGETNTSCAPSGDHDGWQAPSGTFVMGTTARPLISPRYTCGTPERLETNAISAFAVPADGTTAAWVGAEGTVGAKLGTDVSVGAAAEVGFVTAVAARTVLLAAEVAVEVDEFKAA